MSTVNATIWYEALASECGVIIKTDDPALCRAKLYAIRKELKDPDLESIAIMTSPSNPDQDLWLVKKAKDEKERELRAPESDPQSS